MMAPVTVYPLKQLQEMARTEAKKAGGRLTIWAIDVTEQGTNLVVEYRPRHWRHCPACRGTVADVTRFDLAHVGPKGENVAELATVTVAL